MVENPMQALLAAAVLALLTIGFTSINDRIGDSNDRIDETNERITRLEERLEARFVSIDARFASIESRFASIEARIAAQDDKIDEINLKLTALIAALGLTDQVDGALAGTAAAGGTPVQDRSSTE